MEYDRGDSLLYDFESYWMEYDGGDSFPFDFESNGIPIRSENWKENYPHDRKEIGKLIFFSLIWR